MNTQDRSITDLASHLAYGHGRGQNVLQLPVTQLRELHAEVHSHGGPQHHVTVNASDIRSVSLEFGFIAQAWSF